MADELTIFGKVMLLTNLVRRTFRADVGFFSFRIEEVECGWNASTNAGLIPGDRHPTKEAARDWLESEARRIMRECFEIAGEMVVVQEKIAPDFIRVAPVKFSYEAK